MITVSLILVYFGFYLFIVFLSLSIGTLYACILSRSTTNHQVLTSHSTACGLYYLAELIEEYIKTTKKVLTLSIQAELVLHLLLLIDRLPLHCLAIGMASHIAYSRLLKKYPYMSLASGEGLLAGIAFVVNNVAWVRHYHKSYFTLEYIVAFFLVTTWIVPFGFFLSMAGEQAVLPGAGGYPLTTMHSSGSSGGLEVMHSASSRIYQQHDGNKQRKTLALRIFDILRKKRDEVLPEMLGVLPPSAGLMPKEKL